MAAQCLKQVFLQCTSVEDENTYPGSLLWAKIGYHPYWPCMVSYDPLDGNFHKAVKGRCATGEINKWVYHVQFFGKKVSHGWTTLHKFPFEGKARYDKKINELMLSASESLKKKLQHVYGVPSSVMGDWVFAITEAEKAMQYCPIDRFEMYVFNYDVNFKQNMKAAKELKKKRKRTHYKKATKDPKPIVTIPSNIDEFLCRFCEKGSVDLDCCICEKKYHKSCLGLLNTPVSGFICPFCASNNDCQRRIGTKPCIMCNSVASNLKRCTKCDTTYHDTCLVNFKPVDQKRNICPAHVCTSCYSRNPRNGCSKGRLLTCFRCPLAFHDAPNCLPVGSVRLSPSVIVCSQHLLGKNKISPQSSNNVYFCSVCLERGELVCCESCPNAFHKTCINEDVPTGSYYCDDCKSRKYLYSGMIVWAKSGAYRWWPAEIQDIDGLKENLKAMLKFDGEFPIIFYGSDEFAYTHRGKVIIYTDVNKHLKVPSSKDKDIEIKYNLGLEEAAEAYNEYIKTFTSHDSKPAHYRHIRVNRAVFPAVIKNKPQSACLCNIDDENPCGPDSMCLNRTMLYECHADTCNAKDRCQNQRFQKRRYPSLKIFKTPNRGFGLKTRDFIRKGSFITEYVGEVITNQEYEKRVYRMRVNNSQNFYFLYLDKDRLIDAGPAGNLSRFINHSCSPNCTMEKWSVNSDMKIGIFAICDIKIGEELTFDYKSESGFAQECHCGAVNCAKVIGKNGSIKKRKLSY